MIKYSYQIYLFCYAGTINDTPKYVESPTDDTKEYVGFIPLLNVTNVWRLNSINRQKYLIYIFM